MKFRPVKKAQEMSISLVKCACGQKSFKKTTSDTIWFNRVLCIWFCEILLVRTFVGKIHSVKKNKHLRKFYYPAKPEQLFKQTFSPQLPPIKSFMRLTHVTF